MTHLKTASTASKEMKLLIDKFMEKLDKPSQLAIDQLLNAAFLILHGKLSNEEERNEIIKTILRNLSR